MRSDRSIYPSELHDSLLLLEQMAGASSLAEFQSPGGAPAQTTALAGGSWAWQPDLRYRALIEKLPVVTFMAGLDQSLHEMYISPQIETLLGFTPEEWLADPFLWYRQLHPDDRQAWVDAFAQTCSTGAHFRVEYRLIRRDGKVIWVQGECQVVRDETGRPIYMQGIAVDITYRKQTEAIEEARRAADAANKAKSEFLARMSHEIRTPLNGVVGMIDLLRATGLSEAQQRYTQLARDSADSLLRVINDVLDFSKIEAGKIEFDAVDFSFHQLIEDLTELLAPAAAKKNLALACLLRPDVPNQVIGDSTRIRQVLTNLVNNALKFTSKGYVSIRASVECREGKTAFVRVQVEDTGIGIPPDRLDRLFKSFSQVDVSTTRKYGGTGLGLAIAKQLVELMGGEIGVQSEVGRGTLFWFTLKLEVSPVDADKTPDSPAQALRNVRVLAAESDPTHRRIVHEQLEGRLARSSAIVPVEEAAETLRRAARDGKPFAVALIPYDSRSGSELTTYIQSDADLRHLNLIAIMDVDDRTDDAAIRRAGFFARVHRPLVQSRLLDAIASATVQPAGRKTTDCSAGAVTIQSLKGLHLLVAEDNEMNQFVTQETLRRVGCTCDIVADGAQAVEAAMGGKYDGVLMDCQMPVMDGLEAARKIREREASAGNNGHIPIIALTAEAIAGDREKCLAAGMDGYVTKPINAEDLFAAIGARISVRSQRTVVETNPVPAPETSAELSEPVPDAPPPIDLEAVLGRCMRDAQFALRTLEKFCHRAGEDVKLLRKSISAGDMESTSRLAKNLNSVAGHVAAGPLGKIAFEIEQAGVRRDLKFLEVHLACLDVETRRCSQFLPSARETLSKLTDATKGAK